MTGSWAARQRAVVFGRSGGRILWQPRIGCWFDDKMFSGEGLPPPYAGLDLHGVYRALGCAARLYEYNSCFRRVEHPSVRVVERSLSESDTELRIETPVGAQIAVFRKSPNSPHPITLKWEAETPEELKVATWREENAT